MVSTELKPAAKDAPNRTPWISELQQRAETWLTRHFVKPLRVAVTEPGSPVITNIVAIAMQLQAASVHRSTIIEITDGFAEETAPDGGIINFDRHDPALMTHLRSFIPDLRTLKGGCVVLVGAGAHTQLGLHHVDEVREDIRDMLHAAGVRLVWTRSLSLPDQC